MKEAKCYQQDCWNTINTLTFLQYEVSIPHVYIYIVYLLCAGVSVREEQLIIQNALLLSGPGGPAHL